MRNRSAIWVFTILLFLACLYQLSFSWVTRSFESDVKDQAVGKFDSLTQNAIPYFTLNGDTLIVDGNSKKEKQQIVSYYEQKLLSDQSDAPVYPIIDLDYQRCKDQELGLGLDLQGGMSVTLEVSIEDLVKNFAKASAKKPSFRKPYNAALKDYRMGESTVDAPSDDFIGLFAAHYKNMYGDEPMTFFTVGLKDYLDKNSSKSNVNIIAKLREISEDAIEKTHRIIESRINKFGVSQPNIKKLAVSGRLQIELPGAKDKGRIRKLLQSTASLEFWDGAHKDWTNKFVELTKAFSNTANEDTVEKFNELTEDSLSKLSVVDLAIYNEEKATFDSLAELRAVEKSIEDSILLAEGKILNGTLKFAHSPGSPVIGFSKTADTSRVNNILESEKANEIFGQYKRVKFLWSKEYYTKEKGYNFEGHQLMAIEVPKNGEAKINGEDIVDAMQSFDQNSKPSVLLTFESKIADTWSKWTEQKVGKIIAIVLDDQIFSAPVINQKISGGNTEISGGFETIEEAQDLANILKAGSLPVPAVIVDEAIVGPSLGEENILSGTWSLIGAGLLILLYMLFYYKRAGFVANVALVANVFFIFGTLASLGAALTLPGFAGLILTIGMSVDANVLIYERVKEELSNGKGIKLAIQDGYKHAYTAIIDANVTSLLTAIVLAYFGSGPIQGFATTLIIGVFTSLFSAIFITRLIFSYLLDKKWNLSFYRNATKNLFTTTSIKFLSKRKISYSLSAIIVIIGIYSLFTKGLDGSVEFTGGRSYRVEFSEEMNKEEVKTAITEVCENIPPEIKTVDNNFTLEITTKYLEGSETKNKVSKIDSSMVSAFANLGFVDDPTLDSENSFKILYSRGVEKQISNELIQGSFLAVLFSLFVIFIYIAFRFRRWQYGLGALVAMFHDVLVVLGLFSIFYNILPFSMEIDQAFIAAILTVIGYSINDTVVVFDRIREYAA
ncbi:MAG: protein translocase subunit SecD, partial [Bacteroidota bacterium]|nr:protein translocase subunit SecD [Bacteroidota bacterium]